MLELVHIAWTISLLVIFIAIVVWAWSKSQQSRFERAAWAPLSDENVPLKKNGTPDISNLNKVDNHG